MARPRFHSWLTFNTQSLLGGALLGQKKYAEAEPLLVKGYEGLKTREKTIPKQGGGELYSRPICCGVRTPPRSGVVDIRRG
jgi:hypothetical protein